MNKLYIEREVVEWANDGGTFILDSEPRGWVRVGPASA